MPNRDPSLPPPPPVVEPTSSLSVNDEPTVTIASLENQLERESEVKSVEDERTKEASDASEEPEEGESSVQETPRTSRKEVQRDSSLPPLLPIEEMSNLSLDDESIITIAGLESQLGRESEVESVEDERTKEASDASKEPEEEESSEDEESEEEESSEDEEEKVNNDFDPELLRNNDGKVLKSEKLKALFSRTSMPEIEEYPGKYAQDLQYIDIAYEMMNGWKILEYEYLQKLKMNRIVLNLINPRTDKPYITQYYVCFNCYFIVKTGSPVLHKDEVCKEMTKLNSLYKKAKKANLPTLKKSRAKIGTIEKFRENYPDFYKLVASNEQENHLKQIYLFNRLSIKFVKQIFSECSYCNGIFPNSMPHSASNCQSWLSKLNHYADHEEEVKDLELKLDLKKLSFPPSFYYYGLIDLSGFEEKDYFNLSFSDYKRFFYIGMGDENRHDDHADDARRVIKARKEAKARNTTEALIPGINYDKVNRIIKIWDNGGNFMSMKIGPHLHEYTAAMERALISQLFNQLTNSKTTNAVLPEVWTDEDVMNFAIIGLKELLPKVENESASQIFKKNDQIASDDTLAQDNQPVR